MFNFLETPSIMTMQEQRSYFSFIFEGLGSAKSVGTFHLVSAYFQSNWSIAIYSFNLLANCSTHIRFLFLMNSDYMSLQLVCTAVVKNLPLFIIFSIEVKESRLLYYFRTFQEVAE